MSKRCIFTISVKLGSLPPLTLPTVDYDETRRFSRNGAPCQKPTRFFGVSIFGRALWFWHEHEKRIVINERFRPTFVTHDIITQRWERVERTRRFRPIRFFGTTSMISNRYWHFFFYSIIRISNIVASSALCPHRVTRSPFASILLPVARAHLESHRRNRISRNRLPAHGVRKQQVRTDKNRRTYAQSTRTYASVRNLQYGQ